ncbi:hypothetical protein K435DRAFT_643451 [Dendrothele bispora CBS 962.96]|uniref:Uncharacterized protein n=1 Tax=Dendrothele bispora (strain CBS 962.96) TaxID=1314807 RepID=A0A4S8MY45_DENBC|nr:hypothetical protein K435DRAFT_643451 [Dendrothele bispora CBS 962.96]
MSSLSQHTLRQLKLIVPGGGLVWYLDALNEFWMALHSETDWGRTLALASLFTGCTTISLFIYVLLTPWIRGVEPDYRSWRESGILSSVIPMLTTSIVVGWLLLVVSLGQYTSLGYLKSVVGASAIYALTFGLLGLIPAPKVRRS